ncbi:SDR family NAD(P)-dependent oxidoreductase [Sphingomonas sp. CGMCC 1.13654]|uniref:SDR family NAD(P)-dependent oxidoreductase n=1 Tax=Sphingomonas chungangi TaxID=2683589 RepID=A0A838L5P7_9SPHN|nr:SDR family NAD(P)-dependent oxidoreductase [Sphingomonas chungangi]MVW57396.1 SDR family NAD(P)-dependent oxidoreductase [Sphingomonas chungangi]
MADKFAIVTGASTGIGFELAHLAASDGYDVLIVADEPLINSAGADIQQHGVEVRSIEIDLSTFDGVDKLIAATNGRPVNVLCANAGHGLGHGFLDQSPADWRHVIDTNIVGTVYLVQEVVKQMVARGDGKVMLTGSIAGFMPGTYQAVYNGTKAFVDSFADALRAELENEGHSNVTITNLMPGATDTEFFDRAGMGDTSVGQAKKDDPAKVAKDGWTHMMKGGGDIVSGWKNKLQAAAAHVLPHGATAALHKGMAEPGGQGGE